MAVIMKSARSDENATTGCDDGTFLKRIDVQFQAFNRRVRENALVKQIS